MRTLNSSTIDNINNTFDSPRPQTPSHHHQHHHHHHHNSPPRRSKTPGPSTSASSLRYSPPQRPSTPQTRAVKFTPAGNADSRCSPLGLGFQDHHPNQHVLAVTTTTATTTKRSVSSSSAASASKMPTGDNRPRPPQLSAAAAKTVGRTPLTPKIAAKPAHSGTPLVRRTTGNSIATSGSRDESPAPYLANGVTLRGGPRQPRVDSPSSTPSGTPNPERSSEGWDHRSSYGFDGGRQSAQGDALNDNDSKFFRASDARSTLQQPPHHPRPSSGSQKPATFFYANGSSAEAKRTISPPTSLPHSPMLGAAPEPVSSKFFYANGTPDLSSRPTPISSGPPSAGSSSSRLVPGRPSTGPAPTTHGYSNPSRPLSPVKILQQNPPSSILKNSIIPLASNNRPQLSSPPQLAPATLASNKRRVSIESAPRSLKGHSRTGSVPTMETWTSPKLPVSPPQQKLELASPPASPRASQPVITMASLLQAAEDFAEEAEEKDDDDAPGNLQSPTKSTHSTDPVSELVSNARRERKVQDLEITNASLEAINRTLERQLRKQTAELRRYRRLSRSGRFSAPASRVPSETLTDVPISLSDLSEEEDSAHSEGEEEDEEEPDSLDDSELSSTESMSAIDPTSPTDDKIIARRERDERRLQLDLTKHRELLVDSQKINQSLKRCLNWTEVLIKEGQKALEYRVAVSDIKFGGHVLPPPGDDDEDASQLDEDALRRYEAGLEPPWEKSSQDRDSGIELRADGV